MSKKLHTLLLVAAIILLTFLLCTMIVRAISNSRPDYFRNCSEAKANHITNIPKNSSYYRPELDRDHDGYACEV